jgi:hypothetical protein
MSGMANPGFERLRMIRPEVERACVLLASPSAEALDRCAGVLESACTDLARCQPWARSVQGNPEARAEVDLLEAAVRRAGRLLKVARDYYMEWSSRWATLSSGYTPGGEVAAPIRRGLVSLTG